MESRGKLVSVTTDFKTRRRHLTFEVENVSDDELNRLIDADRLDIKAVKYRKKRSKDANALHWKLAGDIANVLGAGIQETHKNLMLKYGTQSIIDGVAEYRITPMGYEPAENEYWFVGGRVHLSRKDGTKEPHILWWVIKGSHLYNTREMSKLIDGTIEEAKALGLETLPPWEIEKIKAEWKPYG